MLRQGNRSTGPSCSGYGPGLSASDSATPSSSACARRRPVRTDGSRCRGCCLQVWMEKAAVRPLRFTSSVTSPGAICSSSLRPICDKTGAYHRQSHSSASRPGLVTGDPCRSSTERLMRVCMGWRTFRSSGTRLRRSSMPAKGCMARCRTIASPAC